MARTSLDLIPASLDRIDRLTGSDRDDDTAVLDGTCDLRMTSANLFGFTARNKISLRSATRFIGSVVSMENFVRIFSRVSAEWALGDDLAGRH